MLSTATLATKTLSINRSPGMDVIAKMCHDEVLSLWILLRRMTKTRTSVEYPRLTSTLIQQRDQHSAIGGSKRANDCKPRHAHQWLYCLDARAVNSSLVEEQVHGERYEHRRPPLPEASDCHEEVEEVARRLGGLLAWIHSGGGERQPTTTTTTTMATSCVGVCPLASLVLLRERRGHKTSIGLAGKCLT